MMKVCIDCRGEKDTSCFHKDTSKRDGYRNECKDCRAIKTKQYYAKNKDTINLRCNQYYKDNQDRLKEKAISNGSKWRKENPHKQTAKSARYKASKRGATPDWLTEKQKAQIEEFYLHARDCRVITGEVYHVDHIIPLRGKNVCGLHVPWNLQILPASVNLSKSNRSDE